MTVIVLEFWKVEKGKSVGKRAQLANLVKSGTLESLLKRRKYSKSKNKSRAHELLVSRFARQI